MLPDGINGADLDRYITGNYGEDSVDPDYDDYDEWDDDFCEQCGEEWIDCLCDDDRDWKDVHEAD